MPLEPTDWKIDVTTPPPGTACGCTCSVIPHEAPCTGVATAAVVRYSGGPKGTTYYACANCSKALLKWAVKKNGPLIADRG